MLIQFQTISSNNKIIQYNYQNPTKCAKMTEEAEKIRNGINGAAANIHHHGFVTSSYTNSGGGGGVGSSNNNISISHGGGQQIDGPHKSSSVSNELGSGATVVIPPNSSTIATTKVGGNNNNNNGPSSTTAPSATVAIGGRLQFFKDGKFILELARSREGEKSGWVSVPRKTYWPPSAAIINTTGTNHQKNESSTSLSFSDDNSSIQSSPWQRDHCWKQSTPRRNISKEMTMYYRRPTLGYIQTEKFHKTAQVKRRRPYDTQSSELTLIATSSSSAEQKQQNGIKQLENDGDDGDVDAGASKSTLNIKIKQELKTSDDEDDNIAEKQESDKIVQETQINIKKEMMMVDDDEQEKLAATEKSIIQPNNIKLENVAVQTPRKYGTRKLLSRQKLNVILQKLIDRIPDSMVIVSATGTHSLVNHLTSTNSRIDLMHQQQQQHVSPRKRILRELEKVSLDDLSTMKRSRAKGANNSICHPIAQSTSSSSVQTTTALSPIAHYSIAAGNQQQHSFPYSGGPSKIVNGSNSEIVATIAQPISKPISSYSITSLLGHNNNNNNPVTTESSIVSSSQHVLDRDHYIRSMVTSPPKSPTASQPIKPSSAFTSKKKSSPSYGNSNRSCLSPASISTTTTPQSNNSINHFNRNASLHSPINYGRTRSPSDLSPSPEQIYSRFRQSHGISNSVSSPSSSTTGFHPYLSSGQSSRGSPSGALSPLSDSHRYRTNLLPPPTSPSHSTYSPAVAVAAAAGNSGSPLSYARYSPSSYSQISPQHCSSKTNYPTPSTAFNLSSIMNSSGAGTSSSKNNRDKSPQSTTTSTTRSESLRDNYIGTRTVPKKTAAFRQQYEANVSSPSMMIPTDSKTSIDAYYKNSMTQHNNEQAHNKRNADHIGSSTTTSLNLSRSKSPSDHHHHHQHHSIKYEKDYRIMNSNSTILPPSSSSSAAAGLDIDSTNSNVIRPSLVTPSSLQHSQNMYYMYGPPPPPPPHSSSVGVATSSPFLSPAYYHSMTLAAAGAAYRNPLWMHFPTAAAVVAAASQSRMPHTQLMPYGSGLGPPMLPPSSTSASTSTPWGLMPPHHHHHHPHHALLADDPVSLVRIKDEPSSDVPLNLSKH